MAEELNWENLIAQAKGQLVKGVNREENAAGAFIHAHGAIDVTKGSVCHAFLRKGPGIKYIVNSLQEGSGYNDNPGRVLAPEVEHWFVDYILNRSIYSEVFVEKDAVKALEEQVVVLDCSKPGNLVGGAAVALRRLWEHVYVARAAYDLSKQGVNEDLAFAIGHCIQAPSKINDTTKISWTANLNWHTSLDPDSLNIKGLKNLVGHKPLTPSEPYVATGSYRMYSDMYGDYAGQGLCAILKGWPKDRCASDKTAVSTNPFGAALKVEAKQGNTFPYKRAIEVMAEWVNTHLMEKIKNA